MTAKLIELHEQLLKATQVSKELNDLCFTADRRWFKAKREFANARVDQITCEINWHKANDEIKKIEELLIKAVTE